MKDRAGAYVAENLIIPVRVHRRYEPWKSIGALNLANRSKAAVIRSHDESRISGFDRASGEGRKIKLDYSAGKWRGKPPYRLARASRLCGRA